MGTHAGVPGIVEMVADSGIFGIAILVYGLVLVVAIVQQFRKVRSADFSQALWGLIAGLVALGVLGTVVGQIAACSAYLSMGERASSELLVLAWRISLGPVVMSSLIATFAAIATGIASTRARRYALAGNVAE